MPISGYFGGHGEQVARKMRKRYGKRWQRVFYATASTQRKRHRRKSALDALRK